MKKMKKSKGIKCAEGVEYQNTLRCRQFKVSWQHVLKALKLPTENIVDIYSEGMDMYIVTDTTITEENVIQND